MSKLLLFAAPSGAGKTTIVRHLLQHFPALSFSISATTRAKRDHEVDGRDYYFLSQTAFRELIDAGAFVEWEEVYAGQYYGTLRREIERLWAEGKHILFDIDVKGALNLKRAYPHESLTVFVKPPSLQAIRERLIARNTETPETLQKRLNRANEELSLENNFDVILVNDILADALRQAEQLVSQFINNTDAD